VLVDRVVRERPDLAVGERAVAVVDALERRAGERRGVDVAPDVERALALVEDRVGEPQHVVRLIALDVGRHVRAIELQIARRQRGDVRVQWRRYRGCGDDCRKGSSNQDNEQGQTIHRDKSFVREGLVSHCHGCLRPFKRSFAFLDECRAGLVAKYRHAPSAT
jgi:hypothetical protein